MTGWTNAPDKRTTQQKKQAFTNLYNTYNNPNYVRPTYDSAGTEKTAGYVRGGSTSSNLNNPTSPATTNYKNTFNNTTSSNSSSKLTDSPFNKNTFNNTTSSNSSSKLNSSANLMKIKNPFDKNNFTSSNTYKKPISNSQMLANIGSGSLSSTTGIKTYNNPLLADMKVASSFFEKKYDKFLTTLEEEQQRQNLLALQSGGKDTSAFVKGAIFQFGRGAWGLPKDAPKMLGEVTSSIFNTGYQIGEGIGSGKPEQSLIALAVAGSNTKKAVGGIVDYYKGNPTALIGDIAFLTILSKVGGSKKLTPAETKFIKKAPVNTKLPPKIKTIVNKIKKDPYKITNAERDFARDFTRKFDEINFEKQILANQKSAIATEKAIDKLMRTELRKKLKTNKVAVSEYGEIKVKTLNELTRNQLNKLSEESFNKKDFVKIQKGEIAKVNKKTSSLPTNQINPASDFFKKNDLVDFTKRDLKKINEKPKTKPSKGSTSSATKEITTKDGMIQIVEDVKKPKTNGGKVISEKLIDEVKRFESRTKTTTLPLKKFSGFNPLLATGTGTILTNAYKQNQILKMKLSQDVLVLDMTDQAMKELTDEATEQVKVSELDKILDLAKDMGVVLATTGVISLLGGGGKTGGSVEGSGGSYGGDYKQLRQLPKKYQVSLGGLYLGRKTTSIPMEVSGTGIRPLLVSGDSMMKLPRVVRRKKIVRRKATRKRTTRRKTKKRKR